LQLIKRQTKDKEEIDALKGENEVLKGKLQELESQQNTRSRSDDEGRQKELTQLERKVQEMSEENSGLSQRIEELER